MNDIPPELLEDLIAEYKEAFATLDSDGDGVVTRADIERILIMFG